MPNSKDIAKLIGPALIALTLPEVFNAHIFTAQSAPVVYLNGGVLFVAGLAIIRVHNHWARDWSVTVTIVGWALMATGLFRLCFPELGQQGASDTSITITSALVASVVGAFLTFKGYRRSNE